MFSLCPFVKCHPQGFECNVQFWLNSAAGPRCSSTSDPTVFENTVTRGDGKQGEEQGGGAGSGVIGAVHQPTPR